MAATDSPGGPPRAGDHPQPERDRTRMTSSEFLKCRSPLPEHHRLAALVLSVLDQIATC